MNHSAMSSSLSKTSCVRGNEGCVRSSHQYKRGLWTEEEDKILSRYIAVHGKGHWNRTAKNTGLNRCGKSCRLRWVNYLSPDVKRGNFSEQEDDLIIRLHKLLGNRWSLIAGRIPGRTDNQVKNYWNTHLSKLNGCGKRQRTESYFPSPDTNSKDSETVTMTPTPLANTNASFAHTADDELFANEINSGAWRDELKHEKSMFHHSLAQFSDEFLEYEFDWNNNLSSLFFG